MRFLLANSGVATGWHGWTMSRGPGAEGAPEKDTKKKKNNKRKETKKKEKEAMKIGNETFQIPGRGPVA